MKIPIKIFSSIVLVFSLLNNNIISNCSTSAINRNYRKINNVSVLLNTFNDPFLSKFKKNLEDIERASSDKVKFTFYNVDNNLAILYEIFDSIILNKENIDLFIINSDDLGEEVVKNLISKAKARNIPLVISNAPPLVASKLYNSYTKVAFVDPSSENAGSIQGKMVANLWNTKKNLLDKNNDNVLQYVLLEGDPTSPITPTRTEGVISTLNSLGIKIHQLQSTNTYWNKDLARLSTENLLIKYANRIETIIANNDYIAIGAIEALEKYGYNTGNKSKYIPVFGIDGTEEAKALVDKNAMAGTVIEDNIPFAKAIYDIAINLINNSPPTKNTPYKIINGGISIPLFYSEYSPHTNS